MLEKTLESLLDSKGIKPVNANGNQPWIFIGRADAEAKLQYLGHLMGREDSLEKTLMLGKIEGRRRTGVTEDEMVGWHHRLNRREFEQILGGTEDQRILACSSPQGLKELDTT